MSEAIPQYLKIRQYVFGIIANAKIAGGSLKIDTEAELCKVFGVCRTTVRKALSQLVTEGLLVRSPSLGTFIHPEIVDSFRIRFDKKLSIGLIYADGMATFIENFFMVQTAKIYDRMRERNCVSRLIFFNNNLEAEARQLSKSKLDGIIWMSPEAKHIPILRIFKSCNIPVVCTFPIFSGTEFNVVAIDYYHCGYTVAKYLLDNHHRKILYINKNPADVEVIKKAGAMAAFAERKVKWRENLWNCKPQGFTETELKEIIGRRHYFSAVNCYEMLANNVKRELTHSDDVQIIHNNFDRSDAVREKMPVIIQPVAKAAVLAVDMLLETINDPESAKKTRQILLKSTIYEPEIFKSTKKRGR